jgi:Domain of unknown function (DUF6249)
MNMKKASTKLLALIFLFTLAIMPLRAQTNVTVADATAMAAVNPSAATTVSTNSKPAPAPQNSVQRRSLWNEMVRNCVPLAWVFISFAIPVTIIAICAYARHHRHKLANETLRVMIEKGQPITPELVDSLKSKNSKSETDGNPSHKDLRNGLILTGVGIGVVMLCGRPGYIILFLGVAFLVIGMLKLGKGGNC